MARIERCHWAYDVDTDVDPLTPAWIVGMFRSADWRMRCTARAIRTELVAFPDLTVDWTEGRGWRYRNIRIRATGPTFAVNAAYRVFRNHLEGTD